MNGCPPRSRALCLKDASAESETIRKACAAGYNSWHTLLADHLTRHGSTNAAELATVVLASIEGGLLLAKTLHDTAPLRGIAAHLRTTLERELP